MKLSRDAFLLKPGSNEGSPRHAINTSEYCLEQFTTVIAELLPVLGQIQQLLESDMLELGEKVLSVESHLIRSLVSIDAAVSGNDKLIAKGRLVSACEHHVANQLKVPNSTHDNKSSYINTATIALQSTANHRDKRTELPVTDIANAPSDQSLLLAHLNAYNIPTKRKNVSSDNNLNRKPFEDEVSSLVRQFFLYHREIAAIKKFEQDHADYLQQVNTQIKTMRAKFKGQKESYALLYLNYLDEFQAQIKQDIRVPQGCRFATIEAYTAWALEDTIMLTLVNLEQECVRVVIALQAYIGYMFTHCIPVLRSTYRQAEVDTTSIIAMHKDQMSRWKDSGFDEMRETLLDVLFPENMRKANVAPESTLTPDLLWTMVEEKLRKQLHLAITGISSVMCLHPKGQQISPILSVCEDFLTVCYRLRVLVNTLANIMNPNQPPQTGFFYVCSEIAQIAKKLMPPTQPEANLTLQVVEDKEIAAVPSPRSAMAPNFNQPSPPGSQSDSPRDSPSPGVTVSASTTRPTDKPQLRAKSGRKSSDVSRLRKSLGKKLNTAEAQGQQPQNVASGEGSSKLSRSTSSNGFFLEPVKARQPRGDIDTQALLSKLQAIEEEVQSSGPREKLE